MKYSINTNEQLYYRTTATTAHRDTDDRKVLSANTLNPVDVYFNIDKILSELRDAGLSNNNIGLSNISVSESGGWCLRDSSSNTQTDDTSKDYTDAMNTAQALVVEEYKHINIVPNIGGDPINVKVSELLSLGYEDKLTTRMFHEIFSNREYYHGPCVIEKGDVVVDIGANVGMFSRFAACAGASVVYSFEPDYNNYRCLALNSPTCGYTFNAAVSDKPGVITFFRDSNIGGHSIFNYDGSNTKTGEKVKVPSVRLSDLFDGGEIDHIDFLKIDAEGAEYGILKELSDNHLSRINKMSMEFHHMILGDDSYCEETIQRLSKYFNYYRLNFIGGHLSMLYFWKK